jgi:hypothetical protein
MEERKLGMGEEEVARTPGRILYESLTFNS